MYPHLESVLVENVVGVERHQGVDYHEDQGTHVDLQQRHLEVLLDLETDGAQGLGDEGVGQAGHQEH